MNPKSKNSNSYKGKSWGYTVYWRSNGKVHVWKYGISSVSHTRAFAGVNACDAVHGAGVCHYRYRSFDNRLDARRWEYRMIARYVHRFGHCPPGQRYSCR